MRRSPAIDQGSNKELQEIKACSIAPSRLKTESQMAERGSERIQLLQSLLFLFLAAGNILVTSGSILIRARIRGRGLPLRDLVHLRRRRQVLIRRTVVRG